MRSETSTRTLALDDSDVVAVAFSASGKRLVAASRDGSVRFWTMDGETVFGFKTEDKPIAIAHISLNADGTQVGVVEGATIVQVRAHIAGEVRPVFDRSEFGATAVVFGRPNTPIAMSHMGYSVLADPKSGKHLAYFNSQVSGEFLKTAAFLWNGRRVLLSDGVATFVYDTDPSKGSKSLIHHRKRPVLARIGDLPTQQAWTTSSSISPGTMRFATSGPDGVVRVWASDDLALLSEFRTQERRIVSVMFTPTGEHLIACDTKGSVFVWRAAPDLRAPKAIGADVRDQSVFRREGRELVRK